MEALGQVGIEFIIWLQGFRTPFLDAFFHFVTQLGGSGYLILLPLVVWSFDLKVGLRAMMAMLSAQLLVMILKDHFHTLRPFMVDDRIWSDGEFGLSFPSGHAWGAMVYYGYLAASVRRRGFTIAMGIVILLVGFSRSYLGVHYPHDVIAGWAFGALMLWGWLRLEAPVTDLYRKLTPVQVQAASTFVPLSLAVLHRVVWDGSTTFGIAGAVTGAAYCLVGCETFGWRGDGSSGLRRAARVLVGAPGILILLWVARTTYPKEMDLGGAVWTWTIGAGMSLYIGFFAPRLFELTRLAPPRREPDAPAAST
jgi:membrane-associated phospholipid phosphatase